MQNQQTACRRPPPLTRCATPPRTCVFGAGKAAGKGERRPQKLEQARSRQSMTGVEMESGVVRSLWLASRVGRGQGLGATLSSAFLALQ